MLGSWCGTAARGLVLTAFFLVSPFASADWHYGTVTQLGFEYNGSTITFRLHGWDRNNCTCAPSWPNQMCLNRDRSTFKEEYAWLLSARVGQRVIGANIDEASCRIVALFEIN